ncbi:MAG: Hsp33 family molecular chaperone HslO [Gammaproteobacteria bacterium]|nr:Hsp33 family molecular chaperone HslO [Gammaproteobacteria bacterium]
MTSHTDSLQRFLFEHDAIRGEVIHLDHSWQDVLSRHDYHPLLRDLLGETMTAGVLLSATLKIEGRLTIQIQGDGPVSLLVAEITVSKDGEQARRSLRGMVRCQQPQLEPGNLAAMFGKGQIVITIQPDNAKERFQGIVALQGETIAAALQAYFIQSEQLDTRLWLQVGENKTAGLLLQRMPSSGEQEAEDWNRILHLASTVSRDELLNLASVELLHRLFHEEDVRVFEAESISFFCSCSRERVAGMLRSLGRSELEEIIQEQGKVAINCEFCLHAYEFDAVDVEQLLVSDNSFESPGSTQ